MGHRADRSHSRFMEKNSGIARKDNELKYPSPLGGKGEQKEVGGRQLQVKLNNPLAVAG